MKSNITCDVDVKTEMIVITVQDQDPLVCAIIADSVCGRLQKFITDYRTSKARNDYAYYKNLTKEAKDDYEKAVDVYSDFCDANRNPILQSALSKRDKLENDMQIKLNTYNAMSTQLEASKAKVQENTPAFRHRTSAFGR
jgi:capsule polysaccharide export protein KpsE/RkpR